MNRQLFVSLFHEYTIRQAKRFVNCDVDITASISRQVFLLGPFANELF